MSPRSSTPSTPCWTCPRGWRPRLHACPPPGPDHPAMEFSRRPRSRNTTVPLRAEPVGSNRPSVAPLGCRQKAGTGHLLHTRPLTLPMRILALSSAKSSVCPVRCHPGGRSAEGRWGAESVFVRKLEGLPWLARPVCEIEEATRLGSADSLPADVSSWRVSFSGLGHTVYVPGWAASGPSVPD